MPLPTIPYFLESRSSGERLERAKRFYFRMDERRAVRDFSPEPVEEEVLEACILAAGTAPSVAHDQPWRFIVVRSPELKRRIREAVERQARGTGRQGAPKRGDLDVEEADALKPYLEDAPALIVVMALRHSDAGAEQRHREVSGSVGIACGFLLAALHTAGLAAFAQVPGSAGPIQRLLERPAHEVPVMLIPVGHPALDCQVPDLRRKQLSEISVWS